MSQKKPKNTDAQAQPQAAQALMQLGVSQTMLDDAQKAGVDLATILELVGQVLPILIAFMKAKKS